MKKKCTMLIMKHFLLFLLSFQDVIRNYKHRQEIWDVFSRFFQLIQACPKGQFCKKGDYSRTFNRKFLQPTYQHWRDAENGLGLQWLLYRRVPRQHRRLGKLRN